MNKSVMGFIVFVFVVSGLIFLGVKEDTDPGKDQEEKEIVVKAENLRQKIVMGLKKRIELIDEVVYHIRLLDEFFGENEDFIQALESCEIEREAAEELLEEIKNFVGQEQFDFDSERLEKSNAELEELLDEFRSFPEDENDLKKGREVTI